MIMLARVPRLIRVLRFHSIFAAENGATDDQLMAIYGWTTKQQTTLYTSKANRRRLAKEGIKHLSLERNEDKNVPRISGVGKRWDKNSQKMTQYQRLNKALVGPEGLEPPTKRL